MYQNAACNNKNNHIISFLNMSNLMSGQRRYIHIKKLKMHPTGYNVVNNREPCDMNVSSEFTTVFKWIYLFKWIYVRRL